MSADQSLAVATNAMCVIAFCTPNPVNATFIAEQISLNPVVVRRVLGKLVSAKLVRSTQGASGGYSLTKGSNQITMQDIYDALSEKGIFERNNAMPQANCDAGVATIHVVNNVFIQAQTAFADVLRNTTLAEVQIRAKKHLNNKT